MKLKYVLTVLAALCGSQANAQATSTVGNNQTWLALTSAMRANGGSQSTRRCFTQTKAPYCHLMLYLYVPPRRGDADGTSVVAFEYYDQSGKLFSREICLGAPDTNIRVCSDWETGVAHSQMLDSDLNAWVTTSEDSEPSLDRAATVKTIRGLSHLAR
jgi:hypothetical protein